MIKNVPDYAHNRVNPYWVYREADGEKWFFGAYISFGRAFAVAEEIGGKVEIRFDDWQLDEPTATDEYLVTYIDASTNERHTSSAIWNNRMKSWLWSDNATVCNKIVAWRLMPEPYEG